MSFLTVTGLLILLDLFAANSDRSEGEELARAISELMPTVKLNYSGYCNTIYFEGTGLPLVCGRW